MMTNKKAIVFFGDVYPMGLIGHLCWCAVESYRICPADVDYYFASISRESQRGSWNIVRSVIPEERILVESDWDSIMTHVVKLANVYDQVLVHGGGGWGYTRCYLRAKRRISHTAASHLKFLGTTHSYRHDSWLRIPMSMFQCLLYLLFYDKIIFQCQDAADRFVGASLLFRAKKGAIVPLGVEDITTFNAQVPDSLAKILNDDSLFKIVYLAVFRPGKQHYWLVKNMVSVLRAHPDLRLLLCGGGDGNVRARVSALVRHEGLETQVLLPGQVPRQCVPSVLEKIQCAIVASRAETFGHSFLEPMFCGVPVIGTRCGIGKDLIKDGETGYGFSLKKPDELLHAVEKVLADPMLVKQMGKNARISVASAFSHSAVARKLMNVYQGVFANG